ncbi:MAG: metallophosphoesterase [Rubrobacteraceae bacterium]
MKVLCVSDRVEKALHGPGLNVHAAGVEAVISCGDLPFEYLEYIVTFLGTPVYYVLGNHDPAPETGKRPGGCTPLDGQVVDVGGVPVAGLSGSRAYSYGPNQYTERQMGLRAWSLAARIWRRKLFGKPVPRVFVSHSPPFGVGDRKDPAHVGFESFLGLLDRYEPTLWLHGHVHLYGPDEPRNVGYGRTRVVNVYGHEILEI